MSILDKANEEVTVWPVVLVDDGYRGKRPGKAVQLEDGTYDPPEGAPLLLRAIIIPTGFAGAGWAADQRFEDQGWAPVARATFFFKWTPEVQLKRWMRLQAQGLDWTIVDQPRYTAWRSTRVWSALAEVRGDDLDG